MNKERIIAIAEWLEGGATHVTPDGEKIGFDMEYWNIRTSRVFEYDNPYVSPECGTVMCIGGAAEQFFGNEGEITVETATAAGLLGLDPNLAEKLFYPWDEDWYTSAGKPDLTPEYMAGVLRRLVDTGKLIG